MKVAVNPTFTVDFEEVMRFVKLKVSKSEARRAVRDEVKFLFQVLCERYMEVPDFSEKNLARHLIKEGLADPAEDFTP